MGSNPKEFIPVSKAAGILHCPQKKVHDLCDQGLIRRKYEGDTVLVRQVDVAEIHRLNIAGEIAPGEMIRRLLFLEREVERLKEAVNMIFEVNGMASSRFMKMEDDQLIQLYQVVENELGEEEWPTKRLLSFCEIFIKITELEVDRLNEMLKIDHSWRTFYELCVKVTKFVALSPDLKTNLDLQRVRDLLSVSRKNLSTIAVLFVERAAELGPSQKLLQRLASNDIDLFDDMAKQLKKNGRRGHLAAL
jgi:hypothetical protein